MLTTADITKLKEIFVTKDELRIELKKLTKTITGTIIGDLTEVITITSNGLQKEINDLREETRNNSAYLQTRIDGLETKLYS
jgi:hypothetical protein